MFNLYSEINEHSENNEVSLRDAYDVLLQARISGERIRDWTYYVRSVSRRINIEFRVMTMLLRDYHYDLSIPEVMPIVSKNTYTYIK